MKRLDFSAPALAAWALLSAAAPAQADTLIDNLAEPVRDVTEVSAALWAAQTFATAGDAVWLDAIELPLGRQVGAPALVAELRADAGGAPGALLASLGVPALTAGEPTVTPLGLAAPVALDAMSSYWLLLGVVGDGSFGWSYANSNVSVGPGVLGNYHYSTDGGASWANFGSDFPYQVRLTVSAVPEPSTLAMLLAGAGVLALRSRRRDSATG